MSALGHERTSRPVDGMSALPPKTDIVDGDWHVRQVPSGRCNASIDARAPRFDRVTQRRVPLAARLLGGQFIIGPTDLGVVADYPFSPMSDLFNQWVGNSATGKSAAERCGRSCGW